MTCVVPPPNEHVPKTMWKESEVVESGVHKRVREFVSLKDNQNWHHEGKEVIVVRTNFKGYHGRIVSTHIDQTALVELNANLRKERFKLTDLSIL